MKYKYDPETGVITGRAGKVMTATTRQGYVSLRGNITAHRWIFEYMTGEPVPDDLQVDHINHDKSDNRWSNLRLVTQAENAKNRSLNSNNKSGVSGVNWYKYTNRWQSHIKVDGKRVHLGYFTEFSEAVNARKNAEVLYGYHENHGKVA